MHQRVHVRSIIPTLCYSNASLTLLLLCRVLSIQLQLFVKGQRRTMVVLGAASNDSTRRLRNVPRIASDVAAVALHIVMVKANARTFLETGCKLYMQTITESGTCLGVRPLCQSGAL
jgi:hypothetical protein